MAKLALLSLASDRTGRPPQKNPVRRARSEVSCFLLPSSTSWDLLGPFVKSFAPLFVGQKVKIPEKFRNSCLGVVVGQQETLHRGRFWSFTPSVPQRAQGRPRGPEGPLGGTCLPTERTTTERPSKRHPMITTDGKDGQALPKGHPRPPLHPPQQGRPSAP